MELKINALYLSIDHQTLVIFLGADVGWCPTIHERMYLWGISSILHCCSCTFTCNCTTLSYHCSCTCGFCWGMSSILHCCSCSCTCLHHPTIVHLHCLGFQPKQNQHHCQRFLGLLQCRKTKRTRLGLGLTVNSYYYKLYKTILS